MRTTIPSRARGTLPIRVSAAERRILEAAAAQRPEYVTTYMREVSLEAALRDLAGDDATCDKCAAKLEREDIR